MSKFRPMLAATAELSDIKYPVYASPKLDGIRGVVIDGKLKSRSLKNIPNTFVSDRFSRKVYDGLDGELIFGSPTAQDVYRQTNSHCSRIEGTPGVSFYIFDKWNDSAIFEERYQEVENYSGEDNLVIVPHHWITNEKELLKYEHDTLDLGYEGLILRGPNEPYKFGRSTLRSQGMLKLKRMSRDEAEILEVFEEMENTNEAKTNELGRTARSSHKAGMVGKGRAGGFHVKDIVTGIEFSLGTGFDDKERALFWKNRKKLIGKVCSYNHFKIGVKVAPRHPVFVALREEFDFPALSN